MAASSLLVVGAAAGIAADRLLHRGGESHDALLARVQRDPLGVIDSLIGLRPEQRARVAAILAARQGAIDSVWHDTHLRLQATLDSVVGEIAAELDPDQAERFRALVAEIHRPRAVRLH